MDGSKVQGAWDEGKIKDIVRYCEDDVTQLAMLYERMAGYYF
mgnify:CR=1 FL=1